MTRPFMPHIYKLTLLLLISFAVLATSSVHAQDLILKNDQTLAPDADRKGTMPRLSIDEEEEKKENPADILDLIAELPPEIQDEFMEEGDQAFEYCSSNYTLSQNYDCSCFTFKFMEARYNLGPELPLMSLVTKTDTSPCAHPALIAGTNYSRCQRIMHSRDYEEKVKEDLCKCVADKMVRAYKSRPLINPRVIDSFFTERVISCERDIALPF